MNLRDSTTGSMSTVPKDYMTENQVQMFKDSVQADQDRSQSAENQAADAVRQRRMKGHVLDMGPMPEPTWRAGYPGLRDFEYWRHQASRYPYIRESDEKSNFFLRGVTVHPRLSDYPMCKEVIADYFTCRESQRALRMFNVCQPVKEQLSSCINLVFVKNHERAAKKFNTKVRGDHQELMREKRLERIGTKAQEAVDRTEKFVD
jgi:hypothetical protein